MIDPNKAGSGEPNAAEIAITPTTTEIVIDTGEGPATVIPLDEHTKQPLTPGLPAAVQLGCTCDPEKNDHGRGIKVPSDPDGVMFVWKNDCPVRRKIDPPGCVSIIG